MWFLLKGLEKFRRQRQQNAQSPDALAPRKLSHHFLLPAKGAASLPDLSLALQQEGFRLTEESDQQAVLFWGDAAAVKFKGIFLSQAEAFPTRVVLRSEENPRSNLLSIQVDEDFGFQHFLGPAKKTYLSKYEEAFTLWEERIRAANS